MLASPVVETATSVGSRKRRVFAKGTRASCEKHLVFAKTTCFVVVSRYFSEDAAEKFGGGLVVWGGWKVSRQGAKARRDHRGVAKHGHEEARKSLHLFVASDGFLLPATGF